MAEKVRLRIGSLAKAVLVTGQAYQDPKDALNEFISNAADEYAEAPGRRGARIRVVLRRRGRYPTIAVDDVGRGMDPDRLREVARNLFKSDKAGDDTTLGEKAIGLLAFQQLGARLDIVSRAQGSDETWCLGLERGKVNAQLERERRRARDLPGTTVYLRDLDREVLRMLTQHKVVDYLRRRRGAALADGAYEVEVVEGRNAELVTPEEPDGVKVPLARQNTLWGPLEFALYVAPPNAASRHVAVVGRAGTTILDDLTELEELAIPPWTGNQVSGRIAFPALQQSAGRRAVLRDDDAFPVFLEAVRSVGPAIETLAERVRIEVDRDTSDRLSDEIRKIFGRVLKELADLDNPMRTPIPGPAEDSSEGRSGDGPGPKTGSGRADGESSAADPEEGSPFEPTLGDLAPEPEPLIPPPGTGATGPSRRSAHLPSLAVDPEPSEARSRFDPDEGIVLFNDRHPDYLVAKDSESGLLDYLAMLVAKEYVVYNNPLASAEELAEEMVRMLVRVHRHLGRRR